MEILFNAIAPIFLVAVLGFVLTKSKILPHSLAAALMQFVLYAAGPALIFYAVISNPISQLLYWRFWLAYPVLILCGIALTFIIFKLILRRSSITAFAAGICVAVSNTALIGYPILSGFIGHVAAIPMSITIIAFMLIFLPCIVFVCESYKQSTNDENKNIIKVILHAVLSTIKHPFLIAVLLALIFMIFHIHPPQFILHFSNSLGETMAPCALFAIGMDLAEFKVEGKLLDIIVANIISLLIMPLMAIFIAKLFHLNPLYSVSLVMLSAMATAKVIYVILSKYGIYVKEAAAIISTTTLCLVFTIPLITLVTKWLWPVVMNGGH